MCLPSFFTGGRMAIYHGGETQHYFGDFMDMPDRAAVSWCARRTSDATATQPSRRRHSQGTAAPFLSSV